MDGYAVKKSVLIILAVIFIPCFSWAATYYIDPTVTGPGTGTIGDPFKYWATLNTGCGGSSCWLAGNTYSQKGGTTSHEKITVGASGADGSVITLNSYGTGKAILYGGEPVSDGSWTGPDGSGVYYFVEGSNYWLLEDNVFLNQPSSKANLGVDGYYWDFHSSGDGKNYYKPTNGTFTGHTREQVFPVGIEIGSHKYITIDNLSFTKFDSCIRASQASTGHGWSNVTVTNCDFSNARYGMWLYTWGAHSSTLTVKNNTFSYLQSGVEFGYGGTEDGTLSDVTSADVSFNTMTHCANVYTASGPASYLWNVVIFPKPVGYSPSTNDLEGIGTQNSINGNFYNNTISGACRGIVQYASLGNASTGNKIYNNYINVDSIGVVMTPASGAEDFGNNSIQYNVIKVGAGDYAVVLSNQTSPTSSYNTFYNNTVISGNTSLEIQNAADYWLIKNNILYGPPNYQVLFEGIANGHITFDYNLYYPVSGDYGVVRYYYNAIQKTLAQWQALGFDTHSSGPQDPLFNSGFYTLQQGSPARFFTGATKYYSADINGLLVHDPPSLGAYEIPWYSGGSGIGGVGVTIH